MLELFGVDFAWFRDADVMVGETGMSTGEFDFGHVAIGAVRLCDGAGFYFVRGWRSFDVAVAGEALGIVESGTLV